MSLAISTGQCRSVVCECGTPVVESQHLLSGVAAHPNGLLHWTKSKHDAPCGLPCFRAGVPPKAYRSGEFHRDNNSCPRCAETKR
jgi:hypothetical protein